MTRSRTIRILVPLAVVLGLVALFAVVGTFSERDGSSGGSIATSAAPKGQATGAERSAFGAAGAAIPAPADGTASTTDVAATIPAASSPSAHYLVRNGALTLVVPRGSLLRAVDRVTALTAGMGGYVVSSSVGSEPIPWPLGAEPALDGQSSAPSGGDQVVTSSGDGYATVTVRVPESQFDTALRRYAALGDVHGVSTSSEDVTTQYVDLEARLDHYRAVERRLVRFLAATEQRAADARRAGPPRQGPAHHRAAHRGAQVAARDHHLRHHHRLPAARRAAPTSWPPARRSGAPSGTRCSCSATVPVRLPSRWWPCCRS